MFIDIERLSDLKLGDIRRENREEILGNTEISKEMLDELEVEVEVSIGSEGTVSLISDLKIVEEEENQEICYIFKEEAEKLRKLLFPKSGNAKETNMPKKINTTNDDNIEKNIEALTDKSKFKLHIHN